MGPKKQLRRRGDKEPTNDGTEMLEEENLSAISELRYEEEEEEGREGTERQRSSRGDAQISPQISRKRTRSATAERSPRNVDETEAEQDLGEDAVGPGARRSSMEIRHSNTNWSIRERSTNLRNDQEGFFHDLNTMQPLRVRLGVCPPFGCSRANTTPMLLMPRKFFVLPEDKGGSDVVGWAGAFTSVSLDLPEQGIYNKASASLTLMLPP
ncbi:hypothetical protein DPX39_050038400 [Trypanosoma brucei equiperdum]|uniref:Uncharacterized protein n=1 Tax=Trypanosoma brucei equiperdum TaxID=630700 RepID=A0A3L6L730_9TRYP|nr:hypothetical protein DPX39_050038400 [Trypanosoma brucei equiperdum]